jgi:hypothetical protein
MPNALEVAMTRTVNEARLEIGKRIWHNYMGPRVLDFPVGTRSQDLATAHLHDLGFTDVEWSQAGDHSLLLSLTYQDDKDHSTTFILEFTGDQMETISLYNFSGEVDAYGS